MGWFSNQNFGSVPTDFHSGYMTFPSQIKILTVLRELVNHLKSLRLGWFGHKNRMSEQRLVRKIFRWKPIAGQKIDVKMML